MFAELITIEESPGSFSWKDAQCRKLSQLGTDGLSGLFFSDRIDDIARAKGICRECPLAEPCLQGALHRREPGGVWGGELLSNGKVLAFKRRRGRPRKYQDDAKSMQRCES